MLTRISLHKQSPARPKHFDPMASDGTSSSTSSRKWRWRRVLSKLSFKIAGSVAVSMLAVLGSMGLLGVDVPNNLLILVPLSSGVFAYVVAHLTLVRRLRLAREILKQVRQRRFENLEAAHLPYGDELNALIWQVYRAGLTMEKEIQEMEKLENYRREFLGNVSHELKTPIFAIQGFTETLLNGAIEDQRINRTFLKKILNNSYRLRNLTNDLVEISRIETGELQMIIAPFNLRDTVVEAVEGLDSLAEAKDVQVEHVLPANLPKVMGDRERIRQVIVNLVDNAIKYSNEGGKVDVVSRELTDGQVELAVVDNGIGIAPQHIARLTERFYRVDKSRSRLQGGTGLGLAIVKHILGAHGTEMEISSRLGHGTTFAFALNTVVE